MMPTWRRPATTVFCPGPWPCTSAEGLSTRRNSAGRVNEAPSSNVTVSVFAARLTRSSIGQGWLSALIAAAVLRPAPPTHRFRDALVLVQGARLVDQHDRNAVADRIGEPRLLADQLLAHTVVAQRPLGQRTDQKVQELGVDLIGSGWFAHGQCRGLAD